MAHVEALSEWQKLPLSEVVVLIGGGTPKTSVSQYWNGDIPWLSVVDFNTGRKYVSDAEKKITSIGLVNSSTKMLNAGDVILSARGTVGAIAVLSKPMAFNQSCYGLRGVTSKSETSFIYYLVKDAVEGLKQISHGGVFDTITKDTFKNITLPIPPIKEQKAIATVLSSLDDKIDLLHHQNTTLEAMAETLFRQWFLEEINEEWNFVELGDYVNCFNGVSYKSSELNSSKVAMVTLKSFDRNGGFRLDGFKEFTGKFKEQHVVVEGDLVVAHTDITQNAEVIGNPVLVVNDSRYEHLVISMDLVKVKSKYDWLSNEFLYRMMRTREFKEHCLGYSNGSTVLHLSKQAIPSFEFFLPPKEKIQKFTDYTKNLFSKKFKNIEQILTLEKLRDNLLPRLMSGEVRIQDD
jgi:type I restriction enzyme S subunit